MTATIDVGRRQKVWAGICVIFGIGAFLLMRVPGSSLTAFGFFEYAWVFYTKPLSNVSLSEICRSVRCGDEGGLTLITVLFFATFLIVCGIAYQFKQ